MTQSVRELPSSASEPARITGLLMGLFAGILAGLFLIFLSALFYPLLLIAPVVAILLPLSGLAARKGTCPHCNAMNTVWMKGKCTSCKHRLEVRSNRIVDLS